MAAEPPWIVTARGHIGVAETPGKATTPIIARWLRTLEAWWDDDATPWCGVFAAACLRESGMALPRHWYRALAWANWGTPLERPVVGAVAVFSRAGGGHVGFVVGADDAGRLLVLGGNQGDRVSVAPFDRDRLVALRWPAGVRLPRSSVVPVVSAAGVASSTREA